MVLCTFANKGRSWERRENRGNIDKAKGLYDLDQDAGEDLEMTATETGFTYNSKCNCIAPEESTMIPLFIRLRIIVKVFPLCNLSYRSTSSYLLRIFCSWHHAAVVAI